MSYHIPTHKQPPPSGTIADALKQDRERYESWKQQETKAKQEKREKKRVQD